MRRLGRFAAGFALGCAGCVAGLRGAWFWALTAAAALGSVMLCIKSAARERRWRPAVLGLAAALFWCGVYQAACVRPIRAFCAQQEAQVEAEVLEYPTKTRFGYGVLVRVKTGGRSIPAVLYYREDAAICPGDMVLCAAKLRAADPDHLDRDEYYASRGVWLTLSCRGALKVSPGKASVRYLPVRAAKWLKDACASCFPQDTAGFMTALLTGDKQGLSYRTRNELSLTGIYHVVAVSGMHVSLFAGLVMLLCAGRRTLGAMAGIPLVWFFVFLTGANASAVRAGVMQTVLMLSGVARRERDSWTAFAAALLLLLLENPWSLRNVGLLLSFASTGGILLFAGPLFRAMAGGRGYARLEEKLPKLSRALRPAMTAVCCSLASSAFSLPICAYYFKLVSVSGFLTNALCLWLVGLVFSIGLPVAVLAGIAPGLAAGFGWLLSWPVRLILGVVHVLSKLPYGAVSLENPYACIFTVFFFCAVWLLCLRPQKLRLMPVMAAILGVFALCMGLAALDYRGGGFVFTALDVGQGQCLVYTQGGQTSVIDCGGTQDESGETAARYLTANGVFSIDRLILTHLDADHCNGAAQLLARVHAEKLYLPESARTEEGAILSGLLAAAAEAGTEPVFVSSDESFPAGLGGLTMFGPNAMQTGNDGGLCVLASDGKYDILITGDLSQMAEYRLLSRHDLQNVELLVAGHHGAKTSTSDALLKQTGAKTVVISVGADNSYGHPADTTLARIAAAGAAVYRTDTMGTIVIRGGSYGKETGGGYR